MGRQNTVKHAKRRMPPRIFIPRTSITNGFSQILTKQTQHKLFKKSIAEQKISLSSTSANDDKDTPTPKLRDLTGPAHPISNIRKISLYEPPNETNLHRRYRQLRQDTSEWNHKFWMHHNTEFTEERETYTQKIIKERYPNDASKTSLNAEEMSEFYKDFLDRNWSAHFHYNVEWQKRNFTIVFLSVLAGIQNVTKKFV